MIANSRSNAWLFGVGLLSLLTLFDQSFALAQIPTPERLQYVNNQPSSIPATKGDGIADDTQAIQAAINGGAQALLLAPGKYRITKTIDVDLQQTGYFSLSGNGVAQIQMEGAGPAFRIRGTHGGTADPSSFKDDVWDRQRAPMIDGVEIVGKHPQACGIEADGSMQLTLTRLVIRKLLHAVRLVNRNRNVLISNCHIYENEGIGVWLDNVDLHQINLSNCHISYNCQGGVVSRSGNVRNLHITGCDIEANMNSSNQSAANVWIDCSGSRHGTAEVAITGCTIQHSKGENTANIRIIGQGDVTNGKADRWGNVTITGNVLSDVATNIHLKNCRGVTLQGNTIWMGYQHNLLIEDCSHIVVGANNLDRNPGYDYGTAPTTKNALVFKKSNDCTVHGLHVSHVDCEPAAVVFEACRRLNISGCTILDCKGLGMLLRDVEDSLVTGCLIQDDRPDREVSPSIRIESGRGNVLSSNRFAQGDKTSDDPR